MVYIFQWGGPNQFAVPTASRQVKTALIREKVKIDTVVFGFMAGKGITNAIFTIWKILEKYGSKGKKLYLAFVDVEKAFDRVPYLEKSLDGLSKESRSGGMMVKAVMAMYEGAQTVVRTT